MGLLIFAATILVAIATDAQAVIHEYEMRTFTSSDGRSVEAALDHYNPSKKTVTLRLTNGQKVKLPMDRFSEEDQKYILDWRSDYDASFVKVNFFGNQIRGGRIIFMLDTSGSMQGDRWEKLVRNMRGVLRQMDSGAEFNLILFGSEARAFKPDLVNATDEVLEEAMLWLESTWPDGGTSFTSAIKAAAPMKKASVYALLSDGYPREPYKVYDLIRENIKKNEVDIRLFTVGYYTSDEGSYYLRDLAKSFNGNYVNR